MFSTFINLYQSIKIFLAQLNNKQTTIKLKYKQQFSQVCAHINITI